MKSERRRQVISKIRGLQAEYLFFHEGWVYLEERGHFAVDFWAKIKYMLRGRAISGLNMTAGVVTSSLPSSWARQWLIHRRGLSRIKLEFWLSVDHQLQIYVGQTHNEISGTNCTCWADNSWIYMAGLIPSFDWYFGSYSWTKPQVLFP